MVARPDISESWYMSCLGCDYPLRAPDSGACPECGRPFDPADESTWRLRLVDRVKLAVLPAVQGIALQTRLTAEGIPSLVEDLGDVIRPGLVVVWVSRRDRDAAQHVNLHGLPEASARAAWTCPGCGETLEGQFDECWRCGAGVRPEA